MANKLWTGNAVNIYQEDTLTIGGTWVQGDSQTLTINGNNLVITVGSSTATASVAAAISAAINAVDRTSSLDGDESINIGGQQIPEFTEIEASVASSVVTVTGSTAGVPVTMTAASPSSTSGTATLVSSVSCTGQHFRDNPDNWSGDAVPVTGDKIIFQQNSVSCLYNLDQDGGATNMTLQIDASYTGSIGLKTRNDLGYDEYRVQHFKLNTGDSERSLVIGEGPGTGSSRIRLNVQSAASTNALIASTGTREVNQKAAVDFIGGTASLTIRRGSLSMAADSTNTATITQLEIGYENQADSDAEVYIGDNANVTTIVKTGGYLEFINASNGVTTLTNYGGETRFNGTAALTTLNLNGGKMVYNSTGALGTASLRGNGWLDFSQDNRAKTVTNPVERYTNESRITDPAKVVSSLVIDNNGITDTSNLTLGTDFRITRAATA